MKTRAKKRAINIAAEVEAWLVIQGATPSDKYRKLSIATKCGMLYITPYADWIACCFDDIENAKEYYGVTSLGSRLNPYSGKWNWHYFETADWLDFKTALIEILP